MEAAEIQRAMATLERALTDLATHRNERKQRRDEVKAECMQNIRYAELIEKVKELNLEKRGIWQETAHALGALEAIEEASAEIDAIQALVTDIVTTLMKQGAIDETAPFNVGNMQFTPKIKVNMQMSLGL